MPRRDPNEIGIRKARSLLRELDTTPGASIESDFTADDASTSVADSPRQRRATRPDGLAFRSDAGRPTSAAGAIQSKPSDESQPTRVAPAPTRPPPTPGSSASEWSVAAIAAAMGTAAPDAPTPMPVLPPERPRSARAALREEQATRIDSGAPSAMPPPPPPDAMRPRAKATTPPSAAPAVQSKPKIDLPRAGEAPTPLPAHKRPGPPSLIDLSPSPIELDEVSPPPRRRASPPLDEQGTIKRHPATLSEQAAALRPKGSAPAREERSVLSRVFKSVVTKIPGALKSLAGLDTAKKASPAPKAPKASEPRLAEEAWRELRTLPIFDGLPNQAIGEALAQGDLALIRASRDDLLDTDGRALLVKSGQVALARFETRKLDEERKAQAARKPPGERDKKAEKKEQKRRVEVGPIIELAERNLAFFEEGDLVDVSFDDGSIQLAAYACYAVTPAALVTVSRARLAEWKREYPFLSDRLRRASQAAQKRIDAVVGAREEVADFFIRHGLSVAQTLRVRQVDKCVECGACEAACEERYGAKRLSLNGRVLGGLDFVDACHTCTDQRCIDPCAFDAIKYDAVRKEILIVEEACTGCTLCATACPYDAIEMHDLDDKPLLAVRLSKEGKLAFGEGTARKAKLKRMASKCDHCFHYEDQACISACPTGALFEVAPADVFHARPEAMRESARAGYDQSVMIDLQKMHDPRVFAGGKLDEKIDRSRT